VDWGLGVEAISQPFADLEALRRGRSGDPRYGLLQEKFGLRKIRITPARFGKEWAFCLMP